jgi:hypothetical protein
LRGELDALWRGRSVGIGGNALGEDGGGLVRRHAECGLEGRLERGALLGGRRLVLGECDDLHRPAAARARVCAASGLD